MTAVTWKKRRRSTRTPNAKMAIPMLTAATRPSTVPMAGSGPGAAAENTTDMTIDLQPGTYELICYLDDSPRGTLTVTEAAAS